MLTFVVQHIKISQNSAITKEIRTRKPVERLFFGIQLGVNKQTNRNKAGRGDE